MIIRRLLGATLVILLSGCSIFGDDAPQPTNREKAVALTEHESCTPYLTHLLFIRLMINDTGCSGRLVDSLIEKPVDCTASIAEKCSKNPDSEGCIAKTTALTFHACEMANCDYWEVNLLCKPEAAH
jgi:hypothetical protein